MKRIIRLTESDLTRIVRRVIRENKNPGDVLDCVATAADLNYNDLFNLAPCANLLTGTPTKEGIESCLEGAKGVIDAKTKKMTFFEKAQYVANLALKSAGCLGAGTGGMTLPGYGGTNIDIKESRRRRY
jgi:hypothetical protein